MAFDHYGREWGQHYQEPLWAAIGADSGTVENIMPAPDSGILGKGSPSRRGNRRDGSKKARGLDGRGKDQEVKRPAGRA